ncbi:MAG: carbamoyltransferase C-terminal domain-containing protein, partial [Candidatus Omnitrophica bacterium]|nr:carbamoyltransferase C-terminal domain-containing protein [Candidatus Omnitrophota bacterium]
MNILGISYFSHDSAAALIKDGRIAAAAQEERFSRKKHDARFPYLSIAWCLNEGGINIAELDYIAYFEKPSFFTHSGLEGMRKAGNFHKLVRNNLKFKGRIIAVPYRLSQAAAAFYPSCFKKSAILILDTGHDDYVTSFGQGDNSALSLKGLLKYPHSLALFYSAFTRYCGFKANSGEYKLMALAAYGEPIYYDLIVNRMIKINENGSFLLNRGYFDFKAGNLINYRFERLFEGRARTPETPVVKKYADIAASAQKVIEEVLLKMCRHIHKLTREDNLCLSGPLALNCVANSRILKEGPFKRIWIQPAASDAGAALGAALFVWYNRLRKTRPADGIRDLQDASLLGPHYSNEDIEEVLSSAGACYVRLKPQEIPRIAAELIAQGYIIGWFQGRLEFGPRALGSRSILADARLSDINSIINQKVKQREGFRPLAPSIMEDYAREWFDFDLPSPYMLFTAKLKENRRCCREVSPGLDFSRPVMSEVPAVTHVDYSCRLQTVNKENNPLFYELLNEYYRITGYPLIVNTSFNIRGEPLVCSPEDALRCFINTKMDYLAIGDFLLRKDGQAGVKAEYLRKETF